jgi:hypothetical protein
VARRYLAKEGADGRIIDGCWIVVEGTLGEQVNNATTLKASEEKTGLGLTVSGGKQGSYTIVLAEGSMLAYKMSKVTKWGKDKKTVDDVADDYMA